jgi:hypothetical protein
MVMSATEQRQARSAGAAMRARSGPDRHRRPGAHDAVQAGVARVCGWRRRVPVLSTIVGASKTTWREQPHGADA